MHTPIHRGARVTVLLDTVAGDEASARNKNSMAHCLSPRTSSVTRRALRHSLSAQRVGLNPQVARRYLATRFVR
jgi:hypothetical protein